MWRPMRESTGSGISLSCTKESLRNVEKTPLYSRAFWLSTKKKLSNCFRSLVWYLTRLFPLPWFATSTVTMLLIYSTIRRKMLGIYWRIWGYACGKEFVRTLIYNCPNGVRTRSYQNAVSKLSVVLSANTVAAYVQPRCIDIFLLQIWRCRRNALYLYN